jgi:hypothetical protein
MDDKPYLYQRDGFEIFPFLSESGFTIVKSFAIGMLNVLFQEYANRSVKEEEILAYHLWGENEKIPHREMLKSKNRHTKATPELQSILLNENLKDLLKRNGIKKFELWDEGLGWLAFRLIRPRLGDGYPFSCKNWGPAKEALSMWIPIIGFDRNLMIHLMPGSHLKEYPKYLPKETHFTKDEYRLGYEPKENETTRPELSVGEALLFHPKMIHAEEVTQGPSTRLNLEFRIKPL